MKAAGLKAADLARMKVASASYLSHILAGEKDPSPRVRRDLARALNVNAHWLESGDGEMRDAKVPPETTTDDVAGQLRGAMSSLRGAGAPGLGAEILDHLSRQVHLLTTLAATIDELKKEVAELREERPTRRRKRGQAGQKPA